MSTATPRIAAEAVEVQRGGRIILRQAYVDAVPGSVTALVGVVGAGKTTLFRVLAGRLRPDRGQVRWDGVPLTRPSLAAMARVGLAFLPDHAWLSPRLTVGQHLAFAARMGGRASPPAASGLGIEWRDRRPDALSSGERRITELALAMALDPVAVVLDEPFRDLDPSHRERLGSLLRGLASAGRAVLFADHDVTSVLAFADRVFGIEAGSTRLIVGFRDRPIAEWYREWPGR